MKNQNLAKKQFSVSLTTFGVAHSNYKGNMPILAQIKQNKFYRIDSMVKNKPVVWPFQARSKISVRVEFQSSLPWLQPMLDPASGWLIREWLVLMDGVGSIDNAWNTQGKNIYVAAEDIYASNSIKCNQSWTNEKLLNLNTYHNKLKYPIKTKYR